MNPNFPDGLLDKPMYNPEAATTRVHDHDHGDRGLVAEPGPRTV
jgi:hypothetical protein